MVSTDMTNLLKLIPLAALLPASLAAHADEGDWYVSPSIAYFDDDGDRLIDDSIAGGQIQVGREMSDKFWLEGLLGYHDIDGFPGQEHLELGVNAIRNFRPDGLFEPYAIGGLGFLRADVGLPSFGGIPAAGDSSTSFTLSAGLGTLVNFGDSPWALRAEWRFRHAFDEEGLTDQLVSLGFQYSFGGGSDLAAPAAVSEPEPVRYADSDGDGLSDGLETGATPLAVAVRLSASFAPTASASAASAGSVRSDSDSGQGRPRSSKAARWRLRQTWPTSMGVTRSSASS